MTKRKLNPDQFDFTEGGKKEEKQREGGLNPNQFDFSKKKDQPRKKKREEDLTQADEKTQQEARNMESNQLLMRESQPEWLRTSLELVDGRLESFPFQRSNDEEGILKSYNITLNVDGNYEPIHDENADEAFGAIPELGGRTGQEKEQPTKSAVNQATGVAGHKFRAANEAIKRMESEKRRLILGSQIGEDGSLVSVTDEERNTRLQDIEYKLDILKQERDRHHGNFEMLRDINRLEDLSEENLWSVIMSDKISRMGELVRIAQRMGYDIEGDQPLNPQEVMDARGREAFKEIAESYQLLEEESKDRNLDKWKFQSKGAAQYAMEVDNPHTYADKALRDDSGRDVLRMLALDDAEEVPKVIKEYRGKIQRMQEVAMVAENVAKRNEQLYEKFWNEEGGMNEREREEFESNRRRLAKLGRQAKTLESEIESNRGRYNSAVYREQLDAYDRGEEMGFWSGAYSTALTSAATIMGDTVGGLEAALRNAGFGNVVDIVEAGRGPLYDVSAMALDNYLEGHQEQVEDLSTYLGDFSTDNLLDSNWWSRAIGSGVGSFVGYSPILAAGYVTRGRSVPGMNHTAYLGKSMQLRQTGTLRAQRTRPFGDNVSVGAMAGRHFQRAGFNPFQINSQLQTLYTVGIPTGLYSTLSYGGGTFREILDYEMGQLGIDEPTPEMQERASNYVMEGMRQQFVLDVLTWSATTHKAFASRPGKIFTGKAGRTLSQLGVPTISQGMQELYQEGINYIQQQKAMGQTPNMGDFMRERGADAAIIGAGMGFSIPFLTFSGGRLQSVTQDQMPKMYRDYTMMQYANIGTEGRAKLENELEGLRLRDQLNPGEKRRILDRFDRVQQGLNRVEPKLDNDLKVKQALLEADKIELLEAARNQAQKQGKSLEKVNQMEANKLIEEHGTKRQQKRADKIDKEIDDVLEFQNKVDRGEEPNFHDRLEEWFTRTNPEREGDMQRMSESHSMPDENIDIAELEAVNNPTPEATLNVVGKLRIEFDNLRSAHPEAFDEAGRLTPEAPMRVRRRVSNIESKMEEFMKNSDTNFIGEAMNMSRDRFGEISDMPPPAPVDRKHFKTESQYAKHIGKRAMFGGELTQQEQSFINERGEMLGMGIKIDTDGAILAEGQPRTYDAPPSRSHETVSQILDGNNMYDNTRTSKDLAQEFADPSPTSDMRSERHNQPINKEEMNLMRVLQSKKMGSKNMELSASEEQILTELQDRHAIHGEEQMVGLPEGRARTQIELDQQRRERVRGQAEKSVTEFEQQPSNERAEILRDIERAFIEGAINVEQRAVMYGRLNASITSAKRKKIAVSEASQAQLEAIFEQNNINGLPNIFDSTSLNGHDIRLFGGYARMSKDVIQELSNEGVPVSFLNFMNRFNSKIEESGVRVAKMSPDSMEALYNYVKGKKTSHPLNQYMYRNTGDGNFHRMGRKIMDDGITDFNKFKQELMRRAADKGYLPIYFTDRKVQQIYEAAESSHVHEIDGVIIEKNEYHYQVRTTEAKNVAAKIDEIRRKLKQDEITNREVQKAVRDMRKVLTDFIRNRVPQGMRVSETKPLITAASQANTPAEIERALNRAVNTFVSVRKRELSKDVGNRIKELLKTETKDGTKRYKKGTADQFEDLEIMQAFWNDDRVAVSSILKKLHSRKEANLSVEQRSKLKTQIEILKAYPDPEKISEKADSFAMSTESGEQISQDQSHFNTLANFINGQSKTIMELEGLIQDLKNIKSKGKSQYEMKREELMDKVKEVRDHLDTSLNSPGGNMFWKNINRFTEAFNQLFRNVMLSPLTTQRMQDTFELLDRFDYSSNTYEGLMASKAGEVMDKVVSEQVTLRQEIDKVHTALARYFGENAADRIRSGTKQVDVNLTKSRVSEDGTIVNHQSKENLTQFEALTWWMYTHNPSNHSTFEKMGYDPEILREEIGSFVGRDMRDFAMWIMQDFMPEYWNKMNHVHRDAFNADMNMHDFYFPLFRDYDMSHAKENMTSEQYMRSSINKGQFQVRKNTDKPFLKADALEALLTHIQKGEHFYHFQETMTQMRAIFDNPEIRNMIDKFDGRDPSREGPRGRGTSPTLKTINSFLDRGMTGRVNREVKSSMMASYLDKARGNFVKASIALSVPVSMKQLTSIPASIPFAGGVRAWNKSLAQFISGTSKHGRPGEIFDMLWNDPMMKERRKGATIDPDAVKQDLTELEGKGFDNLSLHDIYLANLKFGDGTAIVFAGYPVYAHNYEVAKRKGESDKGAHQYAMKHFRRTTQFSQQSSAWNMVSIAQSSEYARHFFPFVSQPIALMNMGFNAMRNIVNGRGNAKRNAQILVASWVVLPNIFEMVNSGFRMDDEEAWKRHLRATLLGPTQGIGFIGSMIAKAYSKYNEMQSFPFSPAPMLDTVTDYEKVLDPVHQILSRGMTAKEMFEALEDISTSGLPELAGIPAGSVARHISGIRDYRRGHTDNIARLMGWGVSIEGIGFMNMAGIAKRHLDGEGKDLSTLHEEVFADVDTQDPEEVKAAKRNFRQAKQMYFVLKEYGRYNPEVRRLMVDLGDNDEREHYLLRKRRESDDKDGFDKKIIKYHENQVISQDLLNRYMRQVEKKKRE